MANFTNLVFTPQHSLHDNISGATCAYFNFPNGYGISVVTGEFAYTSPDRPYEAAIILHGRCYYGTSITDDVLGHQTAEDITKTMALIEALPKP